MNIWKLTFTSVFPFLLRWEHNTDGILGILKCRFFKPELHGCANGKLQAWLRQIPGAAACPCLNWYISRGVNEMMQINTRKVSCLKFTLCPTHRRTCLQGNKQCSFRKLHLLIFTLGLSICNYMHFNGLLLIYTAGTVHFPRPTLTIYWSPQYPCEESYYSHHIDKQGLHFGECLDLVHTFGPLCHQLHFL